MSLCSCYYVPTMLLYDVMFTLETFNIQHEVFFGLRALPLCRYVASVNQALLNHFALPTRPQTSSAWEKRGFLRLVFTSDGDVVGVVIRREERCDLVKIKLTESEAEHRIRLWLRCLRSSENCIVGIASRSGRINQSQCSIRDLMIGWVFRFCFRLRQSSFH